MSEHQQVNPASRHLDDDLQQTMGRATGGHSTADAGFDALLDEIDGLLETNAADYVRSFVQKGGQ